MMVLEGNEGSGEHGEIVPGVSSCDDRASGRHGVSGFPSVVLTVLLATVGLLSAGELGAATFTVTNTANTGAGSLRQAIITANNVAGADLIDFAIPGASCPGGVCTIAVTTGILPTISEQVTLDGTTQADAIVLDVNGRSTGLIVDGASGCVIRGLVIHNYTSRAIRLNATSSSTAIEGNLIGTDAAGAALVGSGQTGIEVLSGGNTIGGASAAERNVIAGNGTAVLIDASVSGNTVSGNFIGTDAAGTSALGNGTGIALTGGANNNLIGGDTAGERNLISGNSSLGIVIAGAGTADNVVSGNFIGVDASGAAALANAGNGVIIGGGATANTVGGTVAGEGNLISGNALTGVRIGGSGTSNNLVVGNLIGTDVTGTAAIPNATGGAPTLAAVQIASGASANVIGGSLPAAANLISGNAGDGVAVIGGASGNAILGNLVGVDGSGAVALPNGRHGVIVWSDPQNPVDAPNNTIGGLGGGEGNVIAGHPQKGVAIDNVGDGNRVLGNFIGTDATGTLDLGNGFGGGSFPAVDVLNGSSAEVRGNLILYNAIGVLVRAQADPMGPFNGNGSLAGDSRDNCVVFNGLGVENSTGSSTTFTNNWWGSVDGPSGVGPGSGDSVSADVVFAPFATTVPAGCPLLAADLSISKSASPDPAVAGSPLTYTVTVTNTGPGAASSVQVVEVLPGAVTFQSTSGCAEDPAGVPICTLGTISAGDNASYTVSTMVDPGASGTLVNSASVGAAEPDPNPGGESVELLTSVGASADLSVTKTASSDSVEVGDPLIYTVTVANAGPSEATGVEVTDVLPAEVTLVATTGCAEDPVGVPLCTLGSIAAGAMAQYTIEVTVDAQGTIANTATVSSSTPDPDPGNDTGGVTTQLGSILEIPTLSDLGLGLLVLVLMSLGVLRLRSNAW